jgi:hypothetical protein
MVWILEKNYSTKYVCALSLRLVLEILFAQINISQVKLNMRVEPRVGLHVLSVSLFGLNQNQNLSEIMVTLQSIEFR